MKENYSINEILNAIEEIQNFKKKKNSDLIQIKKKVEIKSDIPSHTLQLIEEAEKTIKLKLQSE
tara:strand:- start:140 stop:331 length:192 start_codon:yes stop_codon:yes gene_type:complete